MELDVLHIDNHLLVVNKPAGLLAQADETGDTDLLTLAKQHIKTVFNKPGNVYVGLVHRLDRPASGVMVLARTSKAASRLSEQFRTARPLKQYIAVIEGHCKGRGTCRDHLVKENQVVRVVDKNHPGARYAELDWQHLGDQGDLSLLDITLKTGRPHQIRVQLSRMGYPILGDLRYGARDEFDGRNLALHCYRLGLEHPVQKTFMEWTAPPPATWNSFFRNTIDTLLKKHGTL